MEGSRRRSKAARCSPAAAREVVEEGGHAGGGQEVRGEFRVEQVPRSRVPVREHAPHGGRENGRRVAQEVQRPASGTRPILHSGMAKSVRSVTRRCSRP